VTTLATRAELVKLAALLEIPVDELSGLEGYQPGDLRALRETITDRLFESDRRRLVGIATASKMVPAGISARIAEMAFPAPLAARVSGLLEPARAVDLARKVSIPFLAEMTPYLDPRRVSAIIERIPSDIVVKVGRILGDAGEHITMGRFVSYVNKDAIAQTAAVLSDASLLRTGFVLEDPGVLPEMVRLLPPERLRGVIRAAYEEELWPEALNMLDHLDDAARGLLADIAAGEEAAVLDGMVAVAHQEDLWEIALPVARTMNPESRKRFASLPTFGRPEVLDKVVRTAADKELWPELLPLVPLLPVTARREVARIALDLGTEVQERVLAEASEHNLWAPLVTIAAAMGDDVPWESLPWDIGEIVASMGEAEMDAFLADVADADLWGDVLAIAGRVPDEHVARLARQAVALDVAAITTRVIDAADQTGLWAEGLGLLARLDGSTLEELAVHAAALPVDLRGRVVKAATGLGVLDSLGPVSAALA
jgi:hypothetical protein